MLEHNLRAQRLDWRRRRSVLVLDDSADHSLRFDHELGRPRQCDVRRAGALADDADLVPRSNE